ncbi:hypothetical protein SporoP33_13900 [Sporosarcina sp. P33]|nr:hypothetical protein SporoP33_13900 [Sporosarcina sp. P33]
MEDGDSGWISPTGETAKGSPGDLVGTARALPNASVWNAVQRCLTIFISILLVVNERITDRYERLHSPIERVTEVMSGRRHA